MTIRDWYRDGEDVQARLPVLSTMLGHIAPAHTYWYYSDSRVIPMPATSHAWWACDLAGRISVTVGCRDNPSGQLRAWGPLPCRSAPMVMVPPCSSELAVHRMRGRCHGVDAVRAG